MNFGKERGHDDIIAIGWNIWKHVNDDGTILVANKHCERFTRLQSIDFFHYHICSEICMDFGQGTNHF